MVSSFRGDVSLRLAVIELPGDYIKRKMGSFIFVICPHLFGEPYYIMAHQPTVE